MPKSQNLNLTQNLNTASSSFTNADAALTLKPLYVVSAEGAIVKAINVCSDDTVARVLDVVLTVGGVDSPIGSVSIPAGAGTNGALASVNLLSGAIISGLVFDSVGNRVLPLKFGVTLGLRNQTQVTAGKVVTPVAFIEEY